MLQNAYRCRYSRKRATRCRNFAKNWQLPYGSVTGTARHPARGHSAGLPGRTTAPSAWSRGKRCAALSFALFCFVGTPRSGPGPFRPTFSEGGRRGKITLPYQQTGWPGRATTWEARSQLDRPRFTTRKVLRHERSGVEKTRKSRRQDETEQKGQAGKQ